MPPAKLTRTFCGTQDHAWVLGELRKFGAEPSLEKKWSQCSADEKLYLCVAILVKCPDASMQDIANELSRAGRGYLARNMVIGVLSRAEVVKRPAANYPRGCVQRPRGFVKPSAPGGAAALSPQPSGTKTRYADVVSFVPVAVPRPEPIGVRFLDRGRTECAAVLKRRAADGSALCCGHPVAPGPRGGELTSWCAYHVSRYLRPPRRKEHGHASR